MDTTNEEITCISLFTGGGALEAGIRRVMPNLRVIAYVEIEAYAIERLASEIEAGTLDEAPIFTDVTSFPSEAFRDKVHLVAAGYPCQDFSCAGKRKGLEGSRGQMWGFTRAVVNGTRARAFFGENVDGHVSLGLDSVVSDLEEDGFLVKAGIYSAGEVGAPHQRKRVFSLSLRTDPSIGAWRGFLPGNQGWLDLANSPMLRPEWSGRPNEGGSQEAASGCGEWSRGELLEDTNSSGSEKSMQFDTNLLTESSGCYRKEREELGNTKHDGSPTTERRRGISEEQKEGWLQESERGRKRSKELGNPQGSTELADTGHRGRGEKCGGHGDQGGGSSKSGGTPIQEEGREALPTDSLPCGSDNEQDTRQLADDKGIGCDDSGPSGDDQGGILSDKEEVRSESGCSGGGSGDGYARGRHEWWPIRWPARPGEPQHSWEPPRIIELDDSQGNGRKPSDDEREVPREEEGEHTMRPSGEPKQEGEVESGLGGHPDGASAGSDEDSESGGTQGTLGCNRRFGPANELFLAIAGGDKELARWIQFNLQEETMREHRLRMNGNGVVWLTAAKAFSELFTEHLKHWAGE